MTVPRSGPSLKPADYSVPGENYDICNEQSQYLTSPWTYSALASGNQSYTITQYMALSGYGSTLPPLPSYIQDQPNPSTTEGAVIYAPGSSADIQSYTLPGTPVLVFFEGGSYGPIGALPTSGDELIGGSASGYPEPTFNDGDGIDEISYANPSYNGTDIATVAASAAKGATTVTLNSSSYPIVPYEDVSIAGDIYEVQSVSGSQSGYTLTLSSRGLDAAVSSGATVAYSDPAGGVTVQYLNIYNDWDVTGGDVWTGAGWTIENDDFHDSYDVPGVGVAVYTDGDASQIKYDCFSKQGDYGVNINYGSNNVFEYNEVYETNYEPDDGNGASGCGKWWGTLNANIENNYFLDDGPGASPCVWLDNGNSGTTITGNYFQGIAGNSVDDETGFNLEVENNDFVDSGYGLNGKGITDAGDCSQEDCNGGGTINLNSTGGFYVPGSNYENEVVITDNTFTNDWMGLDIWQSGGRSCLNDGEEPAEYCSGGYPNTGDASSNGQYYFSHVLDSSIGGSDAMPTVAAAASSGSSSIVVTYPNNGEADPGGNQAEAIDDQIGFSDPATTSTSSTANVSTFNNSSLAVSSTSGFPSSGELEVGTDLASESQAVGAVLSYTSISGNSFEGVSLVRGAGDLNGNVTQVQPYTVTGETCSANDCKVSITPHLTGNVSAGTSVAQSGTCSLFATAGASPSSPVAPGGGPSNTPLPYWYGCTWQSRDISVTDNTFTFDPSVIAAGPTITGGTTSCTAAHAYSCGTNFMQYQPAGGGYGPWGLTKYAAVDANGMMSSSTFSGCPEWDSGCSTNPLANINIVGTGEYAEANNGALPANDVWNDNTYNGSSPWLYYAYIYSGNPCPYTMPSDPTTSTTLTSNACAVTLSQWQDDWQQDVDSSYNASGDSPTVALTTPISNQEIYGSSSSIDATATANDGGYISRCQLSLNGTNVGSPITTAPNNFTLNTLNYRDGPYNFGVQCADDQSNTGSSSVSAYIGNGDLNGSGSVNISDLAIMAAHWLQTDSNYSDGNITGQAKINLSDLAVLAANWDWSN